MGHSRAKKDMTGRTRTTAGQGRKGVDRTGQNML